MKRSPLFSLGGLLLAAAAFVLINLAAAPTLKQARLDLTENKINTLSDGTRAILSSVKYPVTFKFFLSRQALEEFPGLKSYTSRVQELLEEYALESGGQVSLEVVDPIPFSEDEDAAVGYGLQGIPVGASGTGVFYFGMVAETADEKEVIPFFQPERAQLLEYDLSQLLNKLNNPRKIRVGLINTLRMQGGMNKANPSSGLMRPWAITGFLKRTFDLRLLNQNVAEIPDSLDVLILAQPKHLDPAVQYAIDQYVLRGGKVIAFIDPLSEVSAARNQGEVFLKIEGMQRMLRSWGAELGDNKVVADLGAAQQVSISRTVRTELIDYLPWLELGKDQLTQDDPVTSNLNSIQLATAGVLTPMEGATTQFKPLIQSTERAMLIEAAELSYAPDPRRMLANFKPTGERYAMAARLTGPTQSAFPEGPPIGEDGQPVAPLMLHRAESQKDIDVVVIADSDMLYDRFWVQISGRFGQQVVTPVSNNADMLANAVELLGGSAELINIRSKGTYNRPFTLVEELRQDAEINFRAKEQLLRTQLRETEEKLVKLQQSSGRRGSEGPTAEQMAELTQFRQEQLKVRKELRDVQFQLRKDIEQLENRLKVINIGLIPGLIALAAIALAMVRRRRDRRFKG